jgi:MFS family permease
MTDELDARRATVAARDTSTTGDDITGFDDAAPDDMDAPDVASDEASGEAKAAEPALPSLWRNRDYMGLWTGDAISSLGSSVSSIAYPLLVLFATGSVARAGLITAAGMIGGTVTTLWGGAWADRVSRKALLFWCPLAQAAAIGVVAVLVAAGGCPLSVLVAAAAAGGIAGGIRSGARAPALRRIVPKTQFATATSQMMGRDMAAEFFGSPLGGLLFSMARWLPFGADAVSYVFASLGALLIRRPLGPERDAGQREHDSVLSDVTEGLRYVRRVPFLRFVATWGPMVNVIAGGYFLLFIAVLKYRGASPTVIGLANGLAMTSGVLGAVLGPAVLRRVPARVVFLTAGWLLAAATLLTGLVPRAWQIALAVCLVIVIIVPLNALLDSYQIRIVPDRLSGRVSATVTFAAQSLQWTGPLLAGVLADAFGAPTATLVFGIATVPLAIGSHLARSVRLLDTPVEQVEEQDPLVPTGSASASS